MATNGLEIPGKTVKFDSLALLREELIKQTSNADRLGEFQKTIDEALEKGDREGIIEFTEDEWKSLITNEDLPPIEQVKKLLKNKIEGMKEVKTESKEKREGIMGELDKKVDKVKKSVEDAKEKATSSIKEVLSPIEKIKAGFEKAEKSLGEMWSNLWTPVKFAWYTLWASLGFKFGKDALATMTKEKAEAVVEDVQKKAGEVGKKGEETVKEGKEGIIEKAAPIAILGGAGLGILNFIKTKNILPESIMNKLGDPADKTGFLKKLAGNRALRLFGISGMTLFGIGKLSETLQDPKIAAELGEMPSEPEAQRKWWEKLMNRAGVMSQDILDLVMGKKLDEKLKTKEVPEGYSRIEDHSMTKMAMQEVRRAWGEMQELVRSGGADALKLLGGAVALKSPTLILSAGVKTPLLLMTLMLKPLGVPFAMLAGLFIAIMQGETYLKNICIPDTIQTPKDLSEYLQDILKIDEISEYVGEFLPEGATEDVTAMCDLLSHPDQIQGKINELRKNMKEKIAVGIKGGLELMTTNEQELIQKVNTTGIKNLIGKCTDRVLREQAIKYVPLVEVLKKYETSIITPESYKEIITACQKAGIRLIPSEDHGEKIMDFSVWEGDELVGSGPLCLNPKYSQDEQYETARSTAFNKGFLGYFTLQMNEFQDELNDILRAFEHDPKKAHNAIEKMLYEGGILTSGIYVAGEMTLEYMGKVITIPQKFIGGLFDYLTGKDGSLEIQEGIVAYAGGVIPTFIIGKAGNIFRSRYTKKGIGELVFESLTFPGQIFKKMNQNRAFIWKRRNNLASILTDPVMMMKHNMSSKWLNRLGSMFGNDAFLKSATINEIKGVLLEAQRMKDMNIPEKKINTILDGIKKSIKDNEYGLRDTLSKEGIKIDDLNAHDLKNGLPEKIIATLDGQVDELIKTQGTEIRKVLSKSLEKRLGKSGIRVDSIFDETITDPKQKMEDGKTKIEKKLSDIDLDFERNLSAKEVLKADLDAGRIDISRYNDEMENILKDIRKLGEERKLLSKLHKAIRIHLHFPEKFKLRAKHAGIAALGAAAVYAILNSAYKEGEVPEGLDAMIRDVESDPGFTPSSDEEKKSHDIETSFHKEEVNHELRKIQSSYTALETLITEDLTSADKKSAIESLTEQHQKNLDGILRMLSDPNKRPILEGIMQENKNEEIVLNSFCSLKTENGEAVLSFLDKDGFKKQIWEDVEGSEFLEGIAKGPDSNAAKIAIETGTYMVPFVGTGRDAYDAYEGFSRGNIKDGFIATGWAAIGLVSDVALFTGVGTAAGVAGKAVCAGAKGARMADRAKDVKNAWKMARSDYKLAIEAAKAGKNMDHLSTMQKVALMMHQYGTTKAYLTLSGAQEIQVWITKLRNTKTKLKDIPLQTKQSKQTGTILA